MHSTSLLSVALAAATVATVPTAATPAAAVFSVPSIPPQQLVLRHEATVPRASVGTGTVDTDVEATTATHINAVGTDGEANTDTNTRTHTHYTVENTPLDSTQMILPGLTMPQALQGHDDEGYPMQYIDQPAILKARCGTLTFG
jgi:hypothetical protein